ncbi:MAG: tyrosine-type recombinase/integrase [Candidatus Sericytochromatia bacterium]|nr:tyrosine-type recombinase/integrase [Candidatus Sericytochromatia bacterium]
MSTASVPPQGPDMIRDYLDRLRLKNFSEHTLRCYGLDLRQAEASIGKPLATAGHEELEVYIAGLARKGMKGTTVRRKQASLRGFFNHCLRQKVIGVDPTGNFEPPKVEDRLPIYLNAAQVQALLDALTTDAPSDLREAAIVKALYYTGMRAGELVGLNIEDVFLDERELRVFGKGRRERMLPISDALAQAIAEWLAVHPVGKGALFVSLQTHHRRLSYDSVYKIVKGVMARAGLGNRKFSCHKLRHTFATRLINRKVSIDKIQKLLGHRRIDTTTIYAHTELGSDLRSALETAL